MTVRVDRFADALYTPTEAARYLGVPSQTLRNWVRGGTVPHPDRPDTLFRAVVASVAAPRGHAAIPFVGLAEAYTLRALREAGVPLQRIRPALDALTSEFGIEHALASQRLYTDGAEVLFDYAETTSDDNAAEAVRELVVARHGQRVFADVVQDYLRRVTFEAGYAQVLPLPGYTEAKVVVDAGRGFGQPIFLHGGARLEDVMDLFDAGEPLNVVAEEFGVPEPELEEALRVALRRVA
jgi:DNA-binding transcriptional MerR regulator/uncharacterized protein (DUF433 family)